DYCGIAASVAKMAFGNKLGVKLEMSSPLDAFRPYPCCIVAEVEPSSLDAIDQAMTDESLSDFYDTIGEVTDDGKFTIAGQELTVDEALE
ncbi:hypothetical protein NL364_28655, partial [Klebsiella pneumoniae]|nr:hypothetical protein [Klebsiella pneumoniae]